MRKPDHRERQRKRRARARRAAARQIDRPIHAALERRADARHQVVLDRLHDRAHAAAMMPKAVTAPRPSHVTVVSSPSQPSLLDGPPSDLPVTAAAALPYAAAGEVSAAAPDVPSPAAPPRTGVLAFLRKVRESLFLPVLIALAVIGLSNQLPSHSPPGAHLLQKLAVGSSLPPPDTPLTRSVSESPAAAVTVVASVPALTTLPASETLAVQSAPPVRAPDTSAIAARETDFLPRTRACATRDIAIFKASDAPVEPNAFGLALALAAEAQTPDAGTGDFVVYNDEYFNLRYPGGDVPALYGVCSDVVIRAYRALGIDLQRLVHEARVGSGDTSIDHRRTETLRRFFARHGTKLEVTGFGEDYRPGDIVSYERPQNRGAQVHIAVVSNQIGPSGHPMIVHNRGWGPQIEDALFVDHITGHYRMTGPPKLLTSWGVNKSHGRGLDSWSTLVRRAAINRGSGRTPKAKSNPKM